MYQASVVGTLRALGIPIKELHDWNCCGATSAHFMDAELALMLPARNLALAEAQGVDVLTACAACHHRLVAADHALKSSSGAAARAAELGQPYRGSVQVRHVLSLVDDAHLAARVRRPLTGLRVACYYGCLLVRIPKAGGIDDPENPSIMERTVRACGADVVEWQSRTSCCGASLAVSEPAIVRDMIRPIMEDARAAGADCIAVACPLCQLNLELHQKAAGASSATPGLAVVFITQLTALALGVAPAELGFAHHVVDSSRVVMAATGPGERR
jgi:heterodisulfide reductase subunit B